jgi:anti-sigma regulatory factor (Ser/Thr protein kinase)
VSQSCTRVMAIASTPAAVRTSRRMVADALGASVDDADDLVDRVLLCTSELVTNAIEHGEAPAGLRVSVDDDRVRIEVADSTETEPLVRQPDLTSVRGRGMLIVSRCSDAWGIDVRPGGKTVWCEVATPDQPGRGPMAATSRR